VSQKHRDKLDEQQSIQNKPNISQNDLVKLSSEINELKRNKQEKE